MKWILCLPVLMMSFVSIPAFAQTNSEQDTLLMVTLPLHKVTGERKWENDTVRYRYNQTKYYITTILPYLNEATKMFAELDAKINEPGITKKDRKSFVNTKEDELQERFEADIKKLNTTQGVLLVKLIGRQTGVNIYSMLNEFKNPFTAVRWQTWARINGFNLNKRYDPNDEPMLEHIMESLGYPLPALYGAYENTTVLKMDK
jgi:hypothetical protein